MGICMPSMDALLLGAMGALAGAMRAIDEAGLDAIPDSPPWQIREGG